MGIYLFFLIFLGGLGFRFGFLLCQLRLILGLFFVEVQALFLTLGLQLGDAVFLGDAVVLDLLQGSLLLRGDVDSTRTSASLRWRS